MYKLTVYKANGEITVRHEIKELTAKMLQSSVGGWLEPVPEDFYQVSNKLWFNMQHPNEIVSVWCNEEAKISHENIANPFFVPASWGDSLYGDILVVEKVMTTPQTILDDALVVAKMQTQKLNPNNKRSK